MTIAALLFDLDGTLVDSNEAHVSAWDEVFRAAGLPFDRAAIHHQVGKGGDHLVPALLPDLSRDEAKALAERHGEIYKARYIDAVRPFPGGRDLIVRAHKDKLKVALASSASAEQLDHYVRLLDIADLIDLTTSKDDVESSKPDPDIFQAALDKAGVEPAAALVIGDTPYDVIGAARCGVRTLAMLSGGFPERELRAAGAIAVYRDVAELLARYEESAIRS